MLKLLQCSKTSPSFGSENFTIALSQFATTTRKHRATEMRHSRLREQDNNTSMQRLEHEVLRPLTAMMAVLPLMGKVLGADFFVTHTPLGVAASITFGGYCGCNRVRSDTHLTKGQEQVTEAWHPIPFGDRQVPSPRLLSRSTYGGVRCSVLRYPFRGNGDSGRSHLTHPLWGGVFRVQAVCGILAPNRGQSLLRHSE